MSHSMAIPNLNFAWLINAIANVSSNADVVVNGSELTIINVTCAHARTHTHTPQYCDITYGKISVV